jgi:hypothetical protein
MLKNIFSSLFKKEALYRELVREFLFTLYHNVGIEPVTSAFDQIVFNLKN